MGDLVILAGATGDLGLRIARALHVRGTAVRALVRPGTDPARTAPLDAAGVEVRPVAFEDGPALAAACRDGTCVVSALSGLEPVIVDAQGQLLDAAVAAGVPRFVPSDFSVDYTALPPGTNRNFDLRRRFRQRLDAAPVRATSVFNGAFLDMLNGQMPLIVRPLRVVLYWEDADRRFALTTKDDTAAFTARVAVDPDTPRDLHVAGADVSARDLAGIMSDVTGHRFRLVRLGSLRRLEQLLRLTRRIAPQDGAVFPAWQGMQYLRDMFSGLAPHAPTDNGRYSGLRWTDARTVLARG